jgi:molybdate/tungstate transport system substrate-binding protein
MRSRVHRPLPRLRSLGLACVLFAGAACGGADSNGDADAIVVFNAGSLARPIRAALDTFAAREGLRVEQESAGSLESARKLTELGKLPDVIALADAEVFPRYLMPTHVDGYVEFARNRMVLLYTERSRGAAAVDSLPWHEILRRPEVETGRSDPELDPNGYRTLLVWQLAERHYAIPGLASQLAAASPARNVRPKEADLVGLLQAGEMDFIWSYESMARALELPYLQLPPEIDLSSTDSALAVGYGMASVKVRGAAPNDSITFRGAPIVYAFAVPRNAPHPELAAKFARFLLSEEGRELLQREGLDAIDVPVARGVRAPWMP